MHRMRILLQQKETGLYYSETGEWTPGSAEAMEFVNSSAAIDYCAGNHLSGVQLVLKFPEQKYEIVIPVLPISSQDSMTRRANPRPGAPPG
jgi:hypothetical protein